MLRCALRHGAASHCVGPRPRVEITLENVVGAMCAAAACCAGSSVAWHAAKLGKVLAARAPHDFSATPAGREAFFHFFQLVPRGVPCFFSRRFAQLVSGRCRHAVWRHRAAERGAVAAAAARDQPAAERAGRALAAAGTACHRAALSRVLRGAVGLPCAARGAPAQRERPGADVAGSGAALQDGAAGAGSGADGRERAGAGAAQLQEAAGAAG